jgi:lysophospholipase L1-like esterase
LTLLNEIRRLPSIIHIMKLRLFLLLSFLASISLSGSEPLETKPQDAYFEKFQPVRARGNTQLLLKKGDRLAICGDSITEQKMYSRAMETYLTVCVPDLGVTVRQYGWGGETAPGFLRRMTNDCLRFKPTVATTCYGMNDHGYKPYEESIGQKYRVHQTAIVEAFKAHGARVVLGSPGCVGLNKNWDAASVESKNLNLCTLRNIDIEISQKSGVAFADVFWPMLTAGYAAQQKYGGDYAIAGKDGVHPGWAGSFVMAYAFLKALGLDGEIGTFTYDAESRKAIVSKGHELIGNQDGALQIKSSRYPFCATGDVSKDNSVRSAMTLVPFNQELNRFVLVVSNGRAANYRVAWGDETKSYSASQLAKGVNLADEFVTNPFSAAFDKVDKAVAAKQEYETRQIKIMFHGPEATADIKTVEKLTESVRSPLVAAVRKAFVPVTHTLRVTAE